MSKLDGGNWTDLYGVALDFSRPGKPTDNAFVEAFSERFRQECLNENWFLSREDVVEGTRHGLPAVCCDRLVVLREKHLL